MSTVQYSTVQYSTVQYSRVQYSTVQYRASQRKAGSDDANKRFLQKVASVSLLTEQVNRRDKERMSVE